MRFFNGYVGAVLAISLASTAHSQELTPDEIVSVFERQIEAQNQPLTRSLGGQNARGLTLVTIEDIQAEAVAPQISLVETPSAADTATVSTTTLPASTDTTVATGTAPTLAPITDSLSEPKIVADTATPQTSQTTQIAASADPNKPLVYAKLPEEIRIDVQIKFDYDSAALAQSQKTKLSTMCIAMQTSSIGKFRIIGHTDTSGSDAYNQGLSVLRAKEVARHLVDECGIEAERLETVGMGERFPINEIDTRAEENRRVEFQALS